MIQFTMQFEEIMYENSYKDCNTNHVNINWWYLN